MLGLGVGGRLDGQMAIVRRVWAGAPWSDEVGPIGPAPSRAGGPQVLFGGFRPAALARVARWGDGLLDIVRKAWADHGRDPEQVTRRADLVG